MKKHTYLLLLLLSTTVFAQYKSPRQLYPGLFEKVETEKVFTDSKTFADAIPRQNPAIIQQRYLKHKNDKGFNLKIFVDQHFKIYKPDSKTYISDIKAGVRKHIDTLWHILTRQADTGDSSSLIPLPHPYIVPGGRFSEVYYWDSYFTMLGLQQSGKDTLIANMVNNFAYLIDKFGFIPNGNRTYYLTRSQPPFFCLMVELLAHDEGDKILARYQPEMLAEYRFWTKGSLNITPGTAIDHSVELKDGTILNRYWDTSDKPREESYREDILSAKNTTQKSSIYFHNIRAAAESGWDFSSRWFADGKHLSTINTTSIIPVDLNSLLYHMELTIAKAYQVKGIKDSATIYINKAGKRKNAIIKYCWNEQKGWFMDYNWQTKKQTRIMSLAGTVPMFLGIATQHQVVKLAQNVGVKFLKPGGLVSTFNNTGQQWDWPNAWAPLQYMTITGLENYHQHQLAKTISLKWINLNTRVFEQTGKLLEKYNVTDLHAKAGGGEYSLQDGFGWTNGVLLKLMNQYQ